MIKKKKNGNEKTKCRKFCSLLKIIGKVNDVVTRKIGIHIPKSQAKPIIIDGKSLSYSLGISASVNLLEEIRLNKFLRLCRLSLRLLWTRLGLSNSTNGLSDNNPVSNLLDKVTISQESQRDCPKSQVAPWLLSLADDDFLIASSLNREGLPLKFLRQASNSFIGLELLERLCHACATALRISRSCLSSTFSFFFMELFFSKKVLLGPCYLG